MKILVTGCGRSCTNWVSEIVKATKKFNWVGIPEDRQVFSRLSLPDRYATKLAVEHPTFTKANLRALSEFNPELRILWSLKHPVANVMAKIYRGRPASEGGDKNTENVSADGYIDTAIASIRKSYEMILEAKTVPILIVKVEDLISNHKVMRRGFSSFLAVDRDKIKIHSFENTPNSYHKKRYGKRIDKDQADIYNNWRTVYDGYFADKEELIEQAKKELQDVARFFNYEL